MSTQGIETNSDLSAPLEIATPFTELFGVPLPIVCGPMTGVSDPALVEAAIRAGLLGVLPSANYASGRDLASAIHQVANPGEGLSVSIDTSLPDRLWLSYLEAC
ncbi:MAG: hypothetical protein KC561_18915, partial [Myxococcales bacterium]|nr:hypothetical protein [Myxococcales bacterium]